MARYADGKPSSRHLYQMSQYVPSLNKIVLPGARFTFGDAYNFVQSESFDLTTNTWDATGFIKDVPGVNGAAVVDYDGELWAGIFNFKLNKSTGAWDAGATGADPGTLRHAWATDTLRKQVFGLSWGDGEGSDTGVKAAVMRAGVKSLITISPGAALTQFIADKPECAGMDYDVVNDVFVYYDAVHGRMYKITPTTGNTWSMELYSPTGVGVTQTSGVMCRFNYVASLRGFIIGPPSGNLQFLKTSS